MSEQESVSTAQPSNVFNSLCESNEYEYVHTDQLQQECGSVEVLETTNPSQSLSHLTEQLVENIELKEKERKHIQIKQNFFRENNQVLIIFAFLANHLKFSFFVYNLILLYLFEIFYNKHKYGNIKFCFIILFSITQLAYIYKIKIKQLKTQY